MTADDVVKLLKARYPLDKGYVSLAEVSPPGGAGRYDFLAVSIWASHGYSVDGFEIKRSRADFLNEIRDPSKSQVTSKWCNRWWMVAPLDCGTPEECPAHWGFIAVTKGAEGLSLRQTRKAVTQEPEKRGDAWWATVLLRQATKDRYTQTELSEAESKGWERGYASAEESGKQHSKRIEELLADANKSIRDFEVASGIRINASTWGDNTKLGQAVHALLNRGGLDGIPDRLDRDAADLVRLAEGLRGILQQGALKVAAQGT